MVVLASMLNGELKIEGDRERERERTRDRRREAKSSDPNRQLDDY